MRFSRDLLILISIVLLATACSQQQSLENGQTIIPTDEQRVQNTEKSTSTEAPSAQSEEASDIQDAKNEIKPIELGEPDMNIKVADVEENLNVDKQTFSEIQSYWSNLKGKTVKWAGKVDNVTTKDKFFRVRVLLHDTESGRPFYAVLMGQIQEGDDIESVKKDDQVTFMGKVAKFRPGSPEKGSAIILRGARLVRPE